MNSCGASEEVSTESSGRIIRGGDESQRSRRMNQRKELALAFDNNHSNVKDHQRSCQHPIRDASPNEAFLHAICERAPSPQRRQISTVAKGDWSQKRGTVETKGTSAALGELFEKHLNGEETKKISFSKSKMAPPPPSSPLPPFYSIPAPLVNHVGQRKRGYCKKLIYLCLHHRLLFLSCSLPSFIASVERRKAFGRKPF